MSSISIHPDPTRSMIVHAGESAEEAVIVYIMERHYPDSHDIHLWFASLSDAETWAAELLIDVRAKMSELAAAR